MGLNLLFLGVLLLPWVSALLVACFPKSLVSITLSGLFSAAALYLLSIVS
jgi:hypothetical protein